MPIVLIYRLGMLSFTSNVIIAMPRITSFTAKQIVILEITFDICKKKRLKRSYGNLLF